jgi:ABC-type sugar transport system permease subunit
MGPVLKIAHLSHSPVDFFLALCLGFFFGLVLESGGLANCRKIAGVFYLYDVTVVKVMFSAILTAMLLLFTSSAFGILDLSLLHVPETFIYSYILAGIILGVGMVMGGY